MMTHGHTDPSGRSLGERGEDAAAAYLERVGLTIVERNWRCRSGEIDIVALDGETLVVCEVKTRKSRKNGSGDEAVTPTKQKRLIRLARAYASHAGLTEADTRFDVISILVVSNDRALLRHHRGAFTAS